MKRENIELTRKAIFDAMNDLNLVIAEDGNIIRSVKDNTIFEYSIRELTTRFSRMSDVYDLTYTMVTMDILTNKSPNPSSILPYQITEIEKEQMEDEYYCETQEDGRDVAYRYMTYFGCSSFYKLEQVQDFNALKQIAFNNLAEKYTNDLSLVYSEELGIYEVVSSQNTLYPRSALLELDFKFHFNNNGEKITGILITSRNQMFLFNAENHDYMKLITSFMNHHVYTYEVEFYEVVDKKITKMATLTNHFLR